MKIAVCDDEIKYRETIFEYLKQYKDKYEFEKSEFQRAEELIEYSETNGSFDIIFLDIEMEGLNGVDAARTLKSLNEDVIIIFVTAYTRYISETFRIGAFQFLLKPIKEADFKVDFERAVNAYGQKHRKYTFKTKSGTQVLEYKDIYYIEVYARQIALYTKEKRYSFQGKFSDIYEDLKDYGFSRAHQGYIVNLDKIVSVSGNEINLDNGAKVPLSRNLKKQLMQDLNRHINN